MDRIPVHCGVDCVLNSTERLDRGPIPAARTARCRYVHIPVVGHAQDEAQCRQEHGDRGGGTGTRLAREYGLELLRLRLRLLDRMIEAGEEPRSASLG